MARIFKRADSPYWQIEHRDPSGVMVRLSSRLRDGRMAQRLADKLERPFELVHSGVLSPEEASTSRAAAESIEEHVDAWIEDKRLRSRSPATMSVARSHLLAIIEGCGAVRIGDLTLEAVTRHLAGLRAAGRAARTRNAYRQSAIDFSRWAARTGRSAASQLEALPLADVEGDRRYQRRALTPGEVERLFRRADQVGRGLLYRLAFLQGARRAEIARMRRHHLREAEGVLAFEGIGKARGRVDLVPLHPAMVEHLEREPPTMRAGEPLVPVPIDERTRKADYAASGIEHKDERGLVADFHSARMTLHMALIEAGVSPQVCQQIMRHSDYRTTLAAYTRLNADHLRAGMQLLAASRKGVPSARKGDPSE